MRETIIKWDIKGYKGAAIGAVPGAVIGSIMRSIIIKRKFIINGDIKKLKLWWKLYGNLISINN